MYKFCNLLKISELPPPVAKGGALLLPNICVIITKILSIFYICQYRDGRIYLLNR